MALWSCTGVPSVHCAFQSDNEFSYKPSAAHSHHGSSTLIFLSCLSDAQSRSARETNIWYCIFFYTRVSDAIIFLDLKLSFFYDRLHTMSPIFFSDLFHTTDHSLSRTGGCLLAWDLAYTSCQLRIMLCESRNQTKNFRIYGFHLWKIPKVSWKKARVPTIHSIYSYKKITSQWNNLLFFPKKKVRYLHRLAIYLNKLQLF